MKAAAAESHPTDAERRISMVLVSNGKLCISDHGPEKKSKTFTCHFSPSQYKTLSKIAKQYNISMNRAVEIAVGLGAYQVPGIMEENTCSILPDIDEVSAD